MGQGLEQHLHVAREEEAMTIFNFLTYFSSILLRMITQKQCLECWILICWGTEVLGKKKMGFAPLCREEKPELLAAFLEQ